MARGDRSRPRSLCPLLEPSMVRLFARELLTRIQNTTYVEYAGGSLRVPATAGLPVAPKPCCRSWTRSQWFRAAVCQSPRPAFSPPRNPRGMRATESGYIHKNDVWMFHLPNGSITHAPGQVLTQRHGIEQLQSPSKWEMLSPLCPLSRF
jgi:hypothetical protein